MTWATLFAPLGLVIAEHSKRSAHVSEGCKINESRHVQRVNTIFMGTNLKEKEIGPLDNISSFNYRPFIFDCTSRK